ncbi:MAG: hypothetical protein ABJZ54_00820 [Luteolibacter sp.]
MTWTASDATKFQDHAYSKWQKKRFKDSKDGLKLVIVVDIWLTGFDVPFLDTIYIDKPVQRHNLIQTISRVNRRFENQCTVREVPARIQGRNV